MVSDIGASFVCGFLLNKGRALQKPLEVPFVGLSSPFRPSTLFEMGVTIFFFESIPHLYFALFSEAISASVKSDNGSEG